MKQRVLSLKQCVQDLRSNIRILKVKTEGVMRGHVHVDANPEESDKGEVDRTHQ